MCAVARFAKAVFVVEMLVHAEQSSCSEIASECLAQTLPLRIMLPGTK
jgi:hypothetical protein